MVLCEQFGELGQDELQKTDGGLAIILPNSWVNRLGNYIVNLIDYNIDVSYINAYNDTVTSNGRYDLVKPYPEKPEF